MRAAPNIPPGAALALSRACRVKEDAAQAAKAWATTGGRCFYSGLPLTAAPNIEKPTALDPEFLPSLGVVAGSQFADMARSVKWPGSAEDRSRMMVTLCRAVALHWTLKDATQ